MITKEDALEPLLINETFTKHGITADYLTEKLCEELDAEQNIEFIDKDGEFAGEKRSIAWITRQRARQDAHKLRGDYPAEKTEHSFSDLPMMTAVVREMMKEKSGSS